MLEDKRRAFTLAELLTSLTIIGVIAALTLPVVFQGTSEKSNALALKKTIIKLDEAIELAMTQRQFQPYFECFYWDGGSPTGCRAQGQYDEHGKLLYWTYHGCRSGENPNGMFGKCGDYFSFLKTNLNTLKVCDSNSFANGCTPKYKGRDDVFKDNTPAPGAGASQEEIDIYNAKLSNSTKGCEGWSSSNIKTRPAIVTKDGMILVAYASTTPIFLVDVNGKKGPNKYGYDLFFLTLRAKGNNIPSYQSGGCDFYEKGGKSTAEMLKLAN